MVVKLKDASTPLRADFDDAQVTELLGKHWKATLLKRESLGTDVLRRTHIGTGSGSNGRSAKVVEVQMHEADD